MNGVRCGLTIVVVLTGAAAAEVAGPIVSADLFKNGLAVITRAYTLPGPGEHVAVPLGEPIHGTLWIESAAPVTVRTERRDVEGPAPAPTSLHGALTGQKVEIHLRDHPLSTIMGTLLAAPGAHSPAISGDVIGGHGLHEKSFYVLGGEGGRRTYIAPDQVVFIQGLGGVNAAVESKPVLVFDVPEGTSGAVSVRATYLVRGLSWAPSYRIDLTDSKTLRIGQSAVVRNELDELDGVEAAYISGFPSVEFEQVISPFAPDTSWNTFFSSLARQPAGMVHVATQNVLSNTSALFQQIQQQAGGMEAMRDEGPDLHYQPAGRLSLKTGGTLTHVVAETETAYESVVEWRVPDLRENSGENLQADMWDAVRFRNPFDFPMTTGPAMVVSGGRFLGSRTTHWANPGEETLAYISRTLSIRAGAREQELTRVEAMQLDRRYWRSTVEGTLTLQNRRNETVEVIIHKDLEGTLGQVDGEPKQTVGPAGPGRINPSVNLLWRIQLKPGEERDITYRYVYLAR